MSIPLALVGVGLLCSMSAFGMAIYNIHKMVVKHNTAPTLEDAKFYPIKNTFVSMVLATAFLYLSLLGAVATGWSNNNELINKNQQNITGIRNQVESDPCPRLSGPLSHGLSKKERIQVSKECRTFLANLPKPGYDGKPILPHGLSCTIVQDATGARPSNC